eukprot:366496-Chlamydomonas_euryale.AAC.13
MTESSYGQSVPVRSARTQKKSLIRASCPCVAKYSTTSSPVRTRSLKSGSMLSMTRCSDDMASRPNPAAVPPRQPALPMGDDSGGNVFACRDGESTSGGWAALTPGELRVLPPWLGAPCVRRCMRSLMLREGARACTHTHARTHTHTHVHECNLHE